MNIVLLEPEIPHNTGAIGRTCSVTGSRLHLIRPLGFSTNEKYLRRSGLDYWRELDITYHDSYADFMEYKNGGHGEAALYACTTKASVCYTFPSYKPGDFIMFGKESAGIPESILRENQCVRVPMIESARSLNLSVSAGIVLYEALRQNGFRDLKIER